MNIHFKQFIQKHYFFNFYTNKNISDNVLLIKHTITTKMNFKYNVLMYLNIFRINI